MTGAKMLVDLIRRMQLGPVLFRESHVREHIPSASSMMAASFGTFGRIWSATLRHWVLAASDVS